MKIRNAIYLSLATMVMGSANAAITTSSTDLVVTDHRQGATLTTFYNSLTNLETGNAPTTTASNRFSLDNGDVSGQSFTLASAITLDSLYFGYNEQQGTGSFDLEIDVGNTGTADFTYTVNLTNAIVDGGDLDLTTTGNNGPFHFLQFDLSAASIALGAGTHSFSLANISDNGEGAYLYATLFANNDYAGGDQLVSTGGPVVADGTRDAFFAVTSVPEASTAMLVLFAGSALLLRRRRA